MPRASGIFEQAPDGDVVRAMARVRSGTGLSIVCRDENVSSVKSMVAIREGAGGVEFIRGSFSSQVVCG